MLLPVSSDTTVNTRKTYVAVWLITLRMLVIIIKIPYKNKYWRGTKFGELANYYAIAKFKSRQYRITRDPSRFWC